MIFDHWVENKNGWYTFTVDEPTLHGVAWLKHIRSIIHWIIENIEGAEKHCLWKTEPGVFICKFRHERDYIRFVLRWS